MITYILTAFSFLAANFGWFGGAPQTEIFFWSQIVLAAVVLVVIIGILIAAGGVAGAGVGLIAAFVEAISILLCILAAWICTMLWAVDFFLAFQIMAIGAATASLFRAKASTD